MVGFSSVMLVFKGVINFRLKSFEPQLSHEKKTGVPYFP